MDGHNVHSQPYNFSSRAYLLFTDENKRRKLNKSLIACTCWRRVAMLLGFFLPVDIHFSCFSNTCRGLLMVAGIR